MDLSRWQIVIFECPYRTWTDQLTQRLFGKVIELKLHGYGLIYDEDVLPFDTTDFVGTHLLVCEKGAELTPLWGMKTVSKECCQHFKIPFPPLELADQAGATVHRARIDEVTQSFAGGKLSYTGARTTHPERVMSREEAYHLNQLFILIHGMYQKEQGFSDFVGATVRLNVHKRLWDWGYRPLQDGDGQDLPPLAYPTVAGEQSLLMFRQGSFIERFPQVVDRYGKMWEERLVLKCGSKQTQSG